MMKKKTAVSLLPHSWVGLGVWLIMACALLFPSTGWGHPGPGGLDGAASKTSAFWAGWLHPWSGLDHFLAMVAVGLWAAQLGGRARWMVPGAFVLAMLVGGWWGMGHGTEVWVEPGIAVSVLLLGFLLVFAVRLPWFFPALLVAGFALSHGVAHGSECAQGLAAAPYTAGFVFSTVLLHGLGLAVGMLMERWTAAGFLRWVGGAVAAAGIFLLGAQWPF